MSGTDVTLAPSFAVLSDTDTQSLASLHAEVRRMLDEKFPGQHPELDERCLKPFQKLLAQAPTPGQVRALEYGLGDILKRQFDLDWVTAHTSAGPVIALNIPYSSHLLFPGDWFTRKLAAGKPVNVRTIFLECQDFIQKHLFAADDA